MQPDKNTISEFFVDTGDGHEIYVQDWGKKDAKTPILFLHGGPGAACDDGHKQYFDPSLQRVIFHDQRGCGNSKYTDQLKANTTQKLIQDINKIADKLGLQQFIIVGGSWGSCLALAYALQYPENVNSMVLRGIFTGSHKEIDWLDQGKFRHIFPDVWDTYLAATPVEYHKDPSAYHFRMIEEGTPEQRKKSAYAYECMEYALMSLDDRFIAPVYETYEPAGITIEMHYLHNKCFLPDNHILNNAHNLSMPVWLVQGRYDMICAPSGAYNLSKVLPNGQLIWTVAGHSGRDRANYDLIRNLSLQASS